MTIILILFLLLTPPIEARGTQNATNKTTPTTKQIGSSKNKSPKASTQGKSKAEKVEDRTHARQTRRKERRAERKNNAHGKNGKEEEALGLEEDAPPSSAADEAAALEKFNGDFESTHGVSPVNSLGEIDYSLVNQFSPNTFFDPTAVGNPNQVSTMPEVCQLFSNQNGITYVQPSSVNELGAVIFNGQACSGVKRRDGEFNNWPSESVNGKAKMTPDGVNGKNSSNFDNGVYGPASDSSLKPIWLGSSGSVQIHSLNRLEGNASLAGVSSLGCLVVNQDCMRAINSYVGNNPNLEFTIIPSSQSNSECTHLVNSPQSL